MYWVYLDKLTSTGRLHIEGCKEIKKMGAPIDDKHGTWHSFETKNEAINFLESSEMKYKLPCLFCLKKEPDMMNKSKLN